MKAEYLYVNLDNNFLSATARIFTGTAPSVNVNFDPTDFHVARAGLNYRF